MSQHNLGIRSRFASRYHAHTLIYFENYSEPRTAIAREKQLKKWSREKKEKLIARLNPTWRDLALEMCHPERSEAQRNEVEGPGAAPLKSSPKPGTVRSKPSSKGTAAAPSNPNTKGTGSLDSATLRSG
ncbi:MAG: hypothetical protein M3463_23905 [Verrucomicrobiota bacterium]|nr:hypothetical protein [Verrucomicrobiota bacterium]